MKIQLENVNLTLQKKPILQAINTQFKTGECVGIIGPNGAGKTSLLKVISGLVEPNEGQVSLQLKKTEIQEAGIQISSRKFWLQNPLVGKKPYSEFTFTITQSPKQNRKYPQLKAWQRARFLGYLPQNPKVFWSLSVRDVVALGRTPYQSGFMPLSGQDEITIDQALRTTGIEAFSQRDFQTLSGGEQARVHLARVLAGKAPFLCLDEPITGLDPAYQSRMMKTLCSQSEKGIILILHDLIQAAHFCDRLLVLEKGKLIADAPTEQIISSPLIENLYQVKPIRNTQGFILYEHIS